MKYRRKQIYIMRVLELFSGTGSVGNVCKDLGMDVVSLDRDMPTDIRTDIMTGTTLPTVLMTS
ncbi:MAG: hypothetical protein ACKPKO_00960, partial [Candidatus Fonsibacter sp.]